VTGESFEPYRLVQARRLAGLSTDELAEDIGVARADVLGWEFATKRPRPDQLAKLSKALGVPERFFEAGRPMARVDVAECHFRPVRSTTGHPQ
jgi:transcriptional regulator with XRE-family HTH domain